MTTRRRGRGTVTRVLAGLFLAVLLVFAVYAGYVYAGMRSATQTSGTLSIAGLSAPVRIVRDDRDVPHIFARNTHDLLFAQGFAEASDRLFQMDLLRRYVYGRLAEVMGPAALPADENARIVDIRGIVAGQWAALPPAKRALVQAFSDGTNAAMRREPLPPEFRLLLYKPEPWKPQDSLAVGMATALDLIDPWDDVIRRDEVARAKDSAPQMALYSVTDPAYDAPIDPGKIQPVLPLPGRTASAGAGARPAAVLDRGPIGSNEWAAGASRSKTGRALLANDPHLRLGIPGVWYLVDLHDPQMHVAGGVLAGTPGVVLGHNDDIAWAATNGTVVTEVVYRDSLAGAKTRRETFQVRLGRDVIATYYTTKHGFVVRRTGSTAYAVDWNAVTQPLTPLVTFDGLDRAHSIAQAIDAIRRYPGPPQNFAIADRSGAVAYHLAGLIPKDPLWGLRVHASTDPRYQYIPFDDLPHVAASRSALVFTANNRAYGAAYPYRLTPNFAAPYRAKRIQQMLASKPNFGVADFARFQTDTLSIPERDIARAALAAMRRKHVERDAALEPYVNALSKWNGRFDPASQGAAVAWELRRAAAELLARYNAGGPAGAYQASANGADVMLLVRVIRERPRGWWRHSDYDDLLVTALRTAVAAHGQKLLEPWSRYGATTVQHPLAALGLTFLNGETFPGDGDSYSVHVQTSRDSQSFRAVWDVGNWDAGGISIPSGESGEPGSGHYTDQSREWIEQRLLPLPFSDSAIRAAARATLTLTP